MLAKVSTQDDALLHAALRRGGASRGLRDLEDMDPMLEDVEVMTVCVCMSVFVCVCVCVCEKESVRDS